MDADIAQLVREQRLLEAARLASDRGDARTASLVYEQACDWRNAALEALRAGETTRALNLAIDSGDAATAERAICAVAGDGEVARLAAAQLTRRGRHEWAARLFESCGRDSDAADAWDRAGDAGPAAALFERAGEPARAVHALEAAQRRAPSDHGIALSLGALLLRLGKWEAACRTLQRIPRDAPQRLEALRHIVPALEQSGLSEAAHEAADDLRALGATPIEPADPPAQAAPSRLFGRYEVVREVGSSPSSRVLECIDRVGGERVAVKLLAGRDALGSGRDAIARFEREARVMRSIDHPGVVPMRAFLPEGPAIVLAWMAGGTLEQALAAPEAMSPARAVEIACEILSALGAAHRMGVLHRDVKPANVLFDEAGGVRLNDFGVAHWNDASTTATGAVFGTLAYMSPEQRLGRPATIRSDLFSVGVLLGQMLLRQPPSMDGTWPKKPSQMHPGLEARHDGAVAKMAAISPEDRPADAYEAISILTSLPWPRTTVGAPDASAPAEISEPKECEERLDPALGSFDRWLGRSVEQVLLSAASLERARAFVRADHPALQGVLRVDEVRGEIWLEALEEAGRDWPVSDEERGRLDEAVRALREAGGAQDSVTPRDVVITNSGPVLRFAAGHAGRR